MGADHGQVKATPIGLALPIVCALLAGAGCDEEDLLADYFQTRGYSVPACNTSDELLAGRRELRLYFHGYHEVSLNTVSLQRYYQRHGLRFFTRAHALRIEQFYVFDTDSHGLEALLAMQFPGVDPYDEAAMMRDPALYARLAIATTNYLLRPVLEFARQYGNLGQGVTNLVVLPTFDRPGGGLEIGVGDVVGLALSPALVEAIVRESPAEGALWRGLDLPAAFTPMLFINGRNIAQASVVDNVLRDLLVAHEFGHTAALLHRDEPHNLMLPELVLGESGCNDWLDEDQIATMRATLGLGQPGRALHLEGPAPGRTAPEDTGRALLRRFPPARLRALVRGDRDALRALLSPLLPPRRN